MVTLDYNKTHMVIVADISASMSSMGNIPSIKLNEFLQEQKGDVTVDGWIFNDNYRLLFEDVKASEAVIENLRPYGGTALYSSLGHIIDKTGEKLANITDVRPGRVIFVIYTDGQENESKDEYYGEAGRLLVKSKIEHQQSVYSWVFMFLGSNIDAEENGMSIGITRQTCINYKSSENGYDAVFRCASQAVDRFRNIDPLANHNDVIKHVAFTDNDRFSSMNFNN